MRQPRNRRGVSLLEVVIVLVIIVILAAVGLPRTSRASRATGDSALTHSLTLLRHVIELYAAEHGGAYPRADKIKGALTLYSDVSGATSRIKTTHHIYGPYLREIPALPVGAHRGKSGISTADGLEVGWIYNAATGTIRANTTDQEADDAGQPYSGY